jgi:uncharacterized glyoxalase superfamily protein PhnB
MKIESVIPILYWQDVARSIRYYTQVLGFAAHWSWDDGPSSGGVRDGDTSIFFCRGDQGHKGTWLALNVDQYYQAVKAKGAIILSQPETKPWYMREMMVQDPDGHFLRIGHHTKRE